MDQVRALQKAIKDRYNKPCCIKVGVGVGVVVLLVVVVVVAATVTGGRGQEGDSGGSGGAVTGSGSADLSGDDSGKPTTTSTPAPQPVTWPHQFAVELESQGFQQILAIDDVMQRYIIEMNSGDYFNLYIIVDFPKGQLYYVIMEKGNNELLTNVIEKRILYCESSPFASDFNGRFTSSSALRDGGSTYREQISGRTVTLDATYVGAPYTLSTTLETILNGSCQALRNDQMFKWNTNRSYCGDNTTVSTDTPECSNRACPKFPTESLSIRQACTNFRKCNDFMARCDSSWSQAYDGWPYCVCRSTILTDIDNINCPSVADDGGECDIPKRDVRMFEANAPCYCRYRISRIYPKTLPTTAQNIIWEVKASVITAPAKNYGQCPC